MENPHQRPSPSPVSITPSETPIPTNRVDGSSGSSWSSLRSMHNGQLVPLKTPDHKPSELDRSVTELENGSSAASPSIATSSSASQDERIAAFEANIEQTYWRKIPRPGTYMTDKQQKSGLWYGALQMKKDAAERLLHAQKIIQGIEDEMGEHLTRETIARLRSRFYKIADESTPDGQYISIISDVVVLPSAGMSV